MMKGWFCGTMILLASIAILINSNVFGPRNIYLEQKESLKSDSLSRLVTNFNVVLNQNFQSFKPGSFFGQWLLDENGEQLWYAPNFGKSYVGILIIHPRSGLVKLWKYGSDGFYVILGKYDTAKEIPPKQFVIENVTWDLFRD